MTPSNTIEELVGRVEAATGPDAELDRDIIAALGFDSWAGRMRYRGEGGTSWDFGASSITGSVDAALALAERVLPGWTVQVFQLRRNKGWGARVSSPRYDTYSSFEDDEHATDDGFRGQANGALALLVAILKALRSLRIKGDHNDEAATAEKVEG